jgi:hypothetical protein
MHDSENRGELIILPNGGVKVFQYAGYICFAQLL